MCHVEELQYALQKTKDGAFLQKTELAKTSVSTTAEKHNDEQI